MLLGRRHQAGVVIGEAFQKVRERNTAAREEIVRVEESARREVLHIEATRARTLDKLALKERVEYERVRERGPKAVDKWLNDFDGSF